MPDESLFGGSVPAYYDHYLGPVLFEPYALDLTGRIHSWKKDTVLEIACGTGRVTRHLKNTLSPVARLVATDINPDMLSLAREKLGEKGLEWAIADACELPFANGAFDLLVCQFGVMFFPDKVRAFSEMSRVLAPGGRLLFNVWDRLEFNPRSGLIKKMLEECLGDAAPDFSSGPFAYSDKQQVLHDLIAGGFNRIAIDVVKKTGYYSSVENLVAGFLYGSPLAYFLQKQEPAVREKIRSRLIEEASGLMEKEGIEAPMQAIVFTATT
jgi:SAM-dependent methyltransferase